MFTDDPEDDAPVTRAEFESLRVAVAELLERRTAAATDDGATGDEDTFWALEGLRARLDDPSGAVLYTGAVELLPGESYRWQLGATTAGLLDTSWGELAPALDALAHPVRLELLRRVATGTRRTAELAESDDIGTTGQLHHHLRQLVAAGWLRSAGRGAYEVPPDRVVPLLVTVLAARR